MSQETLGYMELEWTCKSCGTRNRGTTRLCASCGAAMPEDAQFDLPAEHEILTNEEEIARAKRGPDINCAYCGTRNTADAKTCSQCGANIGEGTARQGGEVLGAFSTEAAPEVSCPHCGEMTSASALKCEACGASIGREETSTPVPAVAPKRTGLKILGGIGVVLLLACVAVFGVLLFRTSDVSATVQQVSWEREVDIMEERPVTRETWQDEIPAGAAIGACEKKTRRTQSEPAPNAIKVCGTPYTVNQANGTAKVVQDCKYEIQENWCKYTKDEWTAVDKVSAKGSDYQPRWPEVKLRSVQREGDRRERYQVTFNADGKQYAYSPGNANDYGKFQIESRWTLKVNGLGGVNGVSPAQ